MSLRANLKKIVLSFLFSMEVLFPFHILRSEQIAGVNNTFRIELSAEKASFLRNELVFFMCMVENKSSQEIAISAPYVLGGLRVILVDEKGNPVYRGGVIAHDDTKVKLTPKGKSVTAFELINLNFGQDIGPIGRVLRPGKYKIYATLDGSRSNEIEFTIVAAADRDKSFTDKLLNIERSQRVRGWDYQRAIRDLKKLIHNTPNSPYLKNAYWQMITLLAMYDKGGVELQTQSLELIHAFPNSPMVAFAIHYYKIGIVQEHRFGGELTAPQRNVVDQKLKNIRSQFVGTETIEFIDEVLARGVVYY